MNTKEHVILSEILRRGGEMADATDLKSVDRKVVWVRLPPSAPISSMLSFLDADSDGSSDLQRASGIQSDLRRRQSPGARRIPSKVFE